MKWILKINMHINKLTQRSSAISLFHYSNNLNTHCTSVYSILQNQERKRKRKRVVVTYTWGDK